ncbi:HNH endonuclease signature motif containing protein [Gryllotalpicola protaetiae]|uniref:HNH endonuclease signature motif containing protein n=1 Tax=Gryllotalpicola protaetiae TaxID=2419771 RepID=UPI0013C4E153|nr:HNH endonuclease signature motif containing protein [Gryllotalpicola protaetiae]
MHSLAAAAVGALPCAGDVSGLAGSEQLALLEELSALRRSVDASIALVASDIERKSARELGAESLARKAGLRNGAELVQKVTGSSLGDAKKAVRLGGMLETAHDVAPIVELAEATPAPRSLKVLADLAGDWSVPIAVAVRNGWLSAEHGDRLTIGLGKPQDLESAGVFRAAALRLISDCWEGELTPESVEKAAKAVRACLDREWAQQNAGRLFEQRSLRRTVRADGMVKYDLLVDPLTDAQIWTPIFRRLAPRLGGPRFMTDEERARAEELQQDSRTNEQLLADTFTAFLTAGVTTSGIFGKYAPTVNIAVTRTELKKAIAADTLRRAGQEPPPPADGVGWIDGKPQPITGAQLVTAICDGAAAGVLFDDTGQSLDATKAERTFSTRQRRAMALRDGGCLMPACTMPPEATEAHHINPWSESTRNQKTETKDGVSLCKFDHLNLHNNGGRIERRGSTYWLLWPGQDPTRLIPKHGVIAQLRAEGELA